MLIGTVCYQCHSGLGHLARDFIEYGIINQIMVVPHPHYQNYEHWYPLEIQYKRNELDKFLSMLDVLVVFENAFWWEVPAEARKRGIPFVIIPNYEYTPFPPKVKPDLFLCASLLDLQYYERDYATTYLPMPVNTRRFPWRQRTRALEFVHNAGHGQRGFAKGTPQVVEAMNHVKSPIKLTVRGQPGERRIDSFFRDNKDNPRIELIYGEVPDSELYDRGDVFINAEQYNGMSLMLQEARASGMLVITTDRFPTNTWLPRSPLIPVREYVQDSQAVKFERAIVDPVEIARVIDYFHDTDITQYSLDGREWGMRNSFDALKPRYLEVLGNLKG